MATAATVEAGSGLGARLPLSVLNVMTFDAALTVCSKVFPLVSTYANVFSLVPLMPIFPDEVLTKRPPIT